MNIAFFVYSSDISYGSIKYRRV